MLLLLLASVLLLLASILLLLTTILLLLVSILLLLTTIILLLLASILLLLDSCIALLITLLVALLLLAVLLGITTPIIRLLHVDRTSSEIDIHTTLVGLCMVLQAHFLTHLFHSWLYLLNMIDTVVAFADNDMQVCLSRALRISDSLFHNVLGFLHELAMKVNCVGSYAAFRIVLSKDELGSLFVVLLHLCAMRLALLGQRMRRCTITPPVCLLGFCEA